MQFADFAGNLAAGALIKTNTLHVSLSFLNFSSVFREIFKGKGLLCNRHMQTLMLHYLKGLLVPLLFSSKRYQIPFCSYRMQNPKNTRYKRVLHAVVGYLPAASKVLLIAFRAIAKGNRIPFRANCMQNL
jgi:hypothetical protein